MISMKPELLNYLICSKCASKFSLSAKKTEKNEIINGILKCTKNHKFPIKFGIPRLVVDSENDFVKTESAFSSKWKKFNKTYHNKKWYDSQKKWFKDINLKITHFNEIDSEINVTGKKL